MSPQDLENAIKNYIELHYGYYYNRYIPIQIVGDQYTCSLFLNKDFRPIVIQGEFVSDDAFLNYIYKELDSRRLFTVSFSRLEKELDSIYGETQK